MELEAGYPSADMERAPSEAEVETLLVRLGLVGSSRQGRFLIAAG